MILLFYSNSIICTVLVALYLSIPTSVVGTTSTGKNPFLDNDTQTGTKIKQGMRALRHPINKNDYEEMGENAHEEMGDPTPLEDESGFPLEFVESYMGEVAYNFTDPKDKSPDHEPVVALSQEEIKSIMAEYEQKQHGQRQLASSSAATLQSVVGSYGDGRTPSWLNEAVGGAVLIMCSIAGAAFCATTFCMSAPIAAAACPSIAFFTSVIFGAIDFGSPKNDNAWVTVKTGTNEYAEGRALEIKYHRANGEVDTDSLGWIGVDESKTWEEDLDASWLTYIEFFVDDRNDVCVESIYVTAGIEPSSTGEIETITLTAPQIAFITQTSIGDKDCVYFGDSENAVGNFMFDWQAALVCRDNFFLYNSLDFVNCMRYAMYRYDIMKNGQYRRYSLPASLPSHHMNPFATLKNVGTGMCMDLAYGYTGNGGRVVVWPCYGGHNQLWDFDRDGRFRTIRDPTKCLEGGKNSNLYAKLFIWDCHDGLHQKWTRYSSGRIKNKGTGLYAGVAFCGGQDSPLEFRHYEDGLCGETQKWV